MLLVVATCKHCHLVAWQWEGAEGMAAAAADFNLNQGLVLQAGSLHCTVHSQAGWKTEQPIAHSL